MKQKQIVLVLTLLLLTVTTFFTVNLVQKPQEVRRQAAGTDPGIQTAINITNIFLNSYGHWNFQDFQQVAGMAEANLDKVVREGKKWPGPNVEYERLVHTYIGGIWTSFAYTTKFLTEGNQEYLKKAIAIIEYVDKQFDNNRFASFKRDGEPNGDKKATYEVLNPLLIAVWPIWNQLPPNLQTSLKRHIVDLSNFAIIGYHPYGSYVGNSSGEENAWWPGIPLARAYLMFPNESNSGKWLEQAKVFLFHSLSLEETYGGYTTQTIYKDPPETYLFDNHEYHPHPNYALSTAGSLAATAYLYQKVKGGNVPSEFLHNAKLVFEKHLNYVNLPDFKFKGKKIKTVIRVRGDYFVALVESPNPSLKVCLQYFSSYPGGFLGENCQLLETRVDKKADGSDGPWKSFEMAAFDPPEAKQLVLKFDVAGSPGRIVYHVDNLYLSSLLLENAYNLLNDSQSNFEQGESFSSWKPGGSATQTESRSNYRAKTGSYSLRVDYTGASNTPYYSVFTVLDNTPLSQSNAFFATGFDDWGGDALELSRYRIAKEMLGIVGFNDPETGFSTPNLAEHARTLIASRNYLWKPTGPNIRLTEAELDHNKNSESYKWYMNAMKLADAFTYLSLFDSRFRLASPLVAASPAAILGRVATEGGYSSGGQNNLPYYTNASSGFNNLKISCGGQSSGWTSDAFIAGTNFGSGMTISCLISGIPPNYKVKRWKASFESGGSPSEGTCNQNNTCTATFKLNRGNNHLWFYLLPTSCSGSNTIFSPTKNSSLKVGQRYQITGRGRFSQPAGASVKYIDFHACQPVGTTKNCYAIGRLNYQAENWSYSWTVPNKLIGPTTIWAILLNDSQAPRCEQWTRQDVNISR